MTGDQLIQSAPRPENTLAMAGNSLYNENSSHQYAAMEASLPLLADLEIKGKNITIVDYGCSQGASSIAMMQKIVSRLSHSCSTATVVFNDLPSNDFTSLIKLLPNLKPAYPTKTTIYPCIVPNSFYNPVLAPSTVDVGFALSSVHWLRRRAPPKLPTESIREYLSNRGARNNAAAHHDLIHFLTLRGREMKPGGRLIISCPAPSPDSGNGNNNKGMVYAIYRAMEILIDTGELPVDAMEGAYPPCHVHSEKSIRSAIDETDGTWAMEKFYTQTIVHPAYQTLLNSQAMVADDKVKREAAERVYVEAVMDWILAFFKEFMVAWWVEVGLEEEKTEDVFQRCAELAKCEFAKNGGAHQGIEQTCMFAKLQRL